MKKSKANVSAFFALFINTMLQAVSIAKLLGHFFSYFVVSPAVCIIKLFMTVVNPRKLKYLSLSVMYTLV